MGALGPWESRRDRNRKIKQAETTDRKQWGGAAGRGTGRKGRYTTRRKR